MTEIARHRPGRPAERDRLRGVRGRRRLVVAPAPVRPVRAHRLLRHLAVPARHRALESRPATRSSAASSRGRPGSGPTRTRTSTTRPGAGPAAAPPASTSRAPGRRGRVPRDWRIKLTPVSVVSRGFTGRRRPEVTRLPPGQYLEPASRSCRRPDPARGHRDLAVHDHHRDGRGTPLGLAAVPAAAGRGYTTDIHCVTKWSKFDTHLARRLARHAARRRRDERRLRHGPLLRRLHDQPAAGRPARRQGLGRLRVRRQAAAPRARRPGPAAGAAPVLLEVRQVGHRPGPDDHDQRGFWEELGYHDYGDPWREQRYQGD